MDGGGCNLGGGEKERNEKEEPSQENLKFLV